MPAKSLASANGPAASRGRQNKFQGLKLAFLNALGAEFVVYRAEGRSGEFLDYSVKRFLRKYGWTAKGGFYSEPAEDPEEPDDDDGDEGCLTQAEADAEKERFDVLRTVRLSGTAAPISMLTCLPRFLETGSAITFPLRT